DLENVHIEDHFGPVLVQAVYNRLSHSQFGRGGANDQRVELFADLDLSLAQIRLHDVPRLVEIYVAQVEGLDQQLLQTRPIGRIVGVDHDRAPIDRLENVFVLHEHHVQRLGQCDIVERERKLVRVFERFVKEDVEAELSRQIDDDQLEARPFIEFDPLQEISTWRAIRRLNLVAGRGEIAV